MGRTKKTTADPLSRRERQIMDILYQNEQASAADVREALADPPSYSAVRALLRVLEEKGHVRHEADGNRYLYRPTRPRGQASRAALRHVVQTFFEGSAIKAAAALFDTHERPLDDEQLSALEKLLARAREEEQQ